MQIFDDQITFGVDVASADLQRKRDSSLEINKKS